MVKIIKGEDLVPVYAESIVEVATKICYANENEKSRLVAYDEDDYENIKDKHYVLCGVCVEDDDALSYYPAAVIYTDDADLLDEIIAAEREAGNDIALIENADTYTGSGTIHWIIKIHEDGIKCDAAERSIIEGVISGPDINTVDDVAGVITMRLS